MEELSVEITMPEELAVDTALPQAPVAECQTFNWFKGEKGDKGDTGNTGATGPTGTDGFSPTATVSKSGNTVTISITDKNGTTTETMQDYDSSLFAGKVDLNLNNIDNTNNTAATNLNTKGIRTVIETYSNGTDWYRIWSDGWCEQGKTIQRSSAASTQVTYLKPFINTNYTLVLGFEYGTINNNVGYVELGCKNKATTGFTHASTVGPSSLPAFSYIAKGYIS